jgi:hypothetical protein
MLRRGWLVGLIAGVVLATAVAASALTPVQILAGPEDQLLPYANDAYLGWTQNSTAKPRHYNAFAQPLGTTTRSRLNAASTGGWMGGFDPGTNTAIYQQTEQARSGLFFYDLDTDTRTKIPDVNTPKWEWGPKISSSFILFSRDPLSVGTSRLILFDRALSSSTVIASADEERATIISGGVGDRYATWTVCTARTCNAFYYDTADSSTHRVANPNGRVQYAPVIDETTGSLYFVRSGFACGENVTIRKEVVLGSGDSIVLAQLPQGVDTDWRQSLALNTGSGDTDLLFVRYRCEKEQGDIYALEGVDTVV